MPLVQGFLLPSLTGSQCVYPQPKIPAQESPLPKRPTVELSRATRPPPLRTTGEVETESREIAGMKAGPEKVRRQKNSGIDDFCLLLLVGMFDIVWDVLPDMMHITKRALTVVVDNALCPL